MKIKKIKYTIEEPCHADWDQMKPEAQGRFCASCSTKVVDFTVMSDFSIVSYMESKRNEPVCGRFTEEQLNKDYQWMKPQNHLVSFDLRAVVLGLALSTFSALPSQAQNSVAIEQRDSVATILEGSVQGRIISHYYDHTEETFAGGKIKLSGGDNYNFVKVFLLDSTFQEIVIVNLTKTGVFKIPLDWSKKPVGIKVTAPGYYPQTVYFNRQETIDKLVISLNKTKRFVKGKVLPKGLK